MVLAIVRQEMTSFIPQFIEVQEQPQEFIQTYRCIFFSTKTVSLMSDDLKKLHVLSNAFH